MTLQEILDAIRKIQADRDEARAEAARWEGAWRASDTRAKELEAVISDLDAQIEALEAKLKELTDWDEPEPDPDPEPGAPWTFAFEGYTLEQAKQAAKARVIVDRGPLPNRSKVSGAFNVKESPANGNDYTDVRNEERTPTWQWAYNHYRQDLIETKPMRFANVGMGYQEDPDLAGRVKWFARLWNLPSFIASACDARGGLLADRPWPREHAFYFNVSGSSSGGRLVFEDLGGHGWYMAHRPRDNGRVTANNRPYTECAEHYLYDSALLDLDQDSLRGAHAITYYDPGSQEFPGDVIIHDVAVISGWDFERSQSSNERHPVGAGVVHRPVRSGGAMVVHDYYLEDDSKHPTDLIEISGCVWWMTQANHAVADLRNARLYKFEDSFFRVDSEHRNPVINVGCLPRRIGTGPTLPPEKVTVRNCKSDGVELRVWKTPDAYDVVDLNTEGTVTVWTP